MGSRSPERSRDRRDRTRDRDRGRDRERDHDREQRREKESRREKSSRRKLSRSQERKVSRERKKKARSRSKERLQNNHETTVSKIQEQTLAQIQQQQLQRQLLTQHLLLSQQALGTSTNAMIVNKKQRSVYVGNLLIGIVTTEMLRELFNAALEQFVPDRITNPPVIDVSMDPSGRFAFIELRTNELATEAMKLDKVELCGRHINVGRPKGYVEPGAGLNNQKQLNMAQQYAQAYSGGNPTRFLLLENCLPSKTLRDRSERNELKDEVSEECNKYVKLVDIAIPKPPRDVKLEGGRVYLKFEVEEDAKKIRGIMHTRTFDDNEIKAQYISEDIFERAKDGEWLSTHVVPVTGSVQDINSFQNNGDNWQVSGGSFQNLKEGWMKVRGVPFSATKADLINFFAGCGDLQETNLKMVLGIDGRPTGEAFVEFTGPNADYQKAMLKNKTFMPGFDRYVELFPSTKQECERRVVTGVTLV